MTHDKESWRRTSTDRLPNKARAELFLVLPLYSLSIECLVGLENNTLKSRNFIGGRCIAFDLTTTST